MGLKSSSFKGFLFPTGTHGTSVSLPELPCRDLIDFGPIWNQPEFFEVIASAKSFQQPETPAPERHHFRDFLTNSWRLAKSQGDQPVPHHVKIVVYRVMNDLLID